MSHVVQCVVSLFLQARLSAECCVPHSHESSCCPQQWVLIGPHLTEDTEAAEVKVLTQPRRAMGLESDHRQQGSRVHALVCWNRW